MDALTTLECAQEVRRLLKEKPEQAGMAVASIGMMASFLDVLMGPAFQRARKSAETERLNDITRFEATRRLISKIRGELGDGAREKDIYARYHDEAKKLGPQSVYVPKSYGAFTTWRSANKDRLK